MDETTRVAPDEARSDSYFAVVIGDAQRSVHALPASGKVTLGRAPENDIEIRNPAVSRRHALLDLGPPLTITDLDSANGVRFRGRRIASGTPVPIDSGDVLEIGSSIVLIHRGEAPTIANAEPSAPTLAAVWDEPPVVRAPAMERVYELARRIADSALSVLVLGETGVGKEVIAEAIHRFSPRRAKPFVRVHCAALSTSLLESELFGHERGAFTGASQAKPGLLETADGGTVFLDEVGELPMPVQVKLLRVLEDRSVTRVGSVRARQLDVRFIAATNRDLHDEIASGAFRRDLFYRLNGVSIDVPPLRTRADEIERLASRFAARTSTHPRIAPETLAVLRAYAWPGNVRELRNAIERASLLSANGVIRPVDLPDEIRHGASAPVQTAPPEPTLPRGPRSDTLVPPPPVAETDSDDRQRALESALGDLVRQRTIEALAQCAGNQTRAAALLGISRRTLVSRIKAFDLPHPRKRKR